MMKTARNAIRLLREFSDTSPKLGVSELSRRLDLDRATVHRMLRTLCEDRFIEQDMDTRLYRLGPGVLEIAQSFLRQYGIGEIARPQLEALRDTTGETVGLKILEGRESVCIAAVEGRHAVRVSYYIGERMPLHCTSSGHLFLAYMPPAARKAVLAGKLKKYTAKTVTDAGAIEDMIKDARRKGISVADGNYFDGTRSISTPIIRSNGDLVAVVTVIAPS